jgi:hypothetical protein
MVSRKDVINHKVSGRGGVADRDGYERYAAGRKLADMQSHWI